MKKIWVAGLMLASAASFAQNVSIDVFGRNGGFSFQNSPSTDIRGHDGSAWGRSGYSDWPAARQNRENNNVLIWTDGRGRITGAVIEHDIAAKPFEFGRLPDDVPSYIELDMSQEKMPNAYFSKAVIFDVAMVESKLHKANFSQAQITSTDFSNADLREANFKDATLIDVEFGDADLRKANFLGATMTNIGWESAKLEGAIWSDGRICGKRSLGSCL